MLTSVYLLNSDALMVPPLNLKVFLNALKEIDPDVKYGPAFEIDTDIF